MQLGEVTITGADWTDIILSNDGMTTTFEAAGKSSTAANTGLGGTGFSLGNQVSFPSANSLRGKVSRLITTQSAVRWREHLEMVRARLAA